MLFMDVEDQKIFLNLNDECGQLYDMMFMKQEWGIKGNVMEMMLGLLEVYDWTFKDNDLVG